MKRSLPLTQIPFLAILALFLGGFAEADPSCPELMILERSTNRNRVWYRVEQNSESGANSATISAEWEMVENGPNQWEPLTLVEKNRVYGIKMLPKQQSSDPEFYLVSAPKIIFRLRTDSHTGCPYASYSQVDGPEMNVKKIHLTMKKTILPNIEKAVFIGKSMNDDRALKVEIKF